jgi:hypothetical protein
MKKIKKEVISYKAEGRNNNSLLPQELGKGLWIPTSHHIGDKIQSRFT